MVESLRLYASLKYQVLRCDLKEFSESARHMSSGNEFHSSDAILISVVPFSSLTDIGHGLQPYSSVEPLICRS